MNGNLKNKKIGNTELENINGGNTCHSSWTFQRLGIQPSARHGQRNDYHPVITSAYNTCHLHSLESPHGPGEHCKLCDYIGWRGPTAYCRARSREWDQSGQQE